MTERNTSGICSARPKIDWPQPVMEISQPHCWHDDSSREERGPGGYVDYRRCCFCGQLQRFIRIPDPSHGPHAPKPEYKWIWENVEDYGCDSQT